jgi:hypothetical protein
VDADVLSAVVAAMTFYRNNAINGGATDRTSRGDVLSSGADVLRNCTMNSEANVAISEARLVAVFIAVIEAPSPPRLLSPQTTSCTCFLWKTYSRQITLARLCSLPRRQTCAES